ncbi:hypothetical protein BDF14DRAFT_1808100 [Spinellus fusiger]|nr:hypothetical protein BDF14DRAFT_1808100 [Spinellus fusiger]
MQFSLLFFFCLLFPPLLLFLCSFFFSFLFLEIFGFVNCLGFRRSHFQRQALLVESLWLHHLSRLVSCFTNQYAFIYS